MYEKKLVEVETPDGPVIAMIYVMAERYEHRREYVTFILTGDRSGKPSEFE